MCPILARNKQKNPPTNTTIIGTNFLSEMWILYCTAGKYLPRIFFCWGFLYLPFLAYPPQPNLSPQKHLCVYVNCPSPGHGQDQFAEKMHRAAEGASMGSKHTSRLPCSWILPPTLVNTNQRSCVHKQDAPASCLLNFSLALWKATEFKQLSFQSTFWHAHLIGVLRSTRQVRCVPTVSDENQLSAFLWWLHKKKIKKKGRLPFTRQLYMSSLISCSVARMLGLSPCNIYTKTVAALVT